MLKVKYIKLSMQGIMLNLENNLLSTSVVREVYFSNCVFFVIPVRLLC